MRLPVLVLSLLASSAAVFASQTCILVDRSGSMRPHYESISASQPDTNAALVPTLADAMGRAASLVVTPDYAMFDVDLVPAPQGVHDPQFHVTGKDTRLTNALRTEIKSHKYIWLLTDNVEDYGNDTDMSEFYALLHTSEVREVRIFPVLEKSSLHRSGVLVYALSINGDPQEFQKQIDTFNSLLASTPRLQQLHVQELLMRPLGANAIREVPVASSARRTFHEGDILHIEATISIQPREPYLYFDESPVNAGASGSASDLPLTQLFPDAPCLDVEKRIASVTPTTVRTDNVINYTVSLEYGRVRLHRSLPCIWTAAFVHSHASQRINTPLTVRVPKGRFHFTHTFISQFASAPPTGPAAQRAAIEQGKIAGIVPLPEELADEETVIPISVPLEMDIRYPTWPGILLLLIAILLVAGIIALLVVLPSFTSAGKLSVTLEDGTPLPAELRAGTLYVQGRSVGRVENGTLKANLGIRLDDGARTAPIHRPIRCTLPEGTLCIIEFGKAPTRSKTPTRGASPRTAATPRPPITPRRR